MLDVTDTLQGACAVWYNLMLSGEGDYDTRHAACPVLSGSKWGALHCLLVRGGVVAFSVECQICS